MVFGSVGQVQREVDVLLRMPEPDALEEAEGVLLVGVRVDEHHACPELDEHFEQLVDEGLRYWARAQPRFEAQYREARQAVASGQLTPGLAVDSLLEALLD